MLFKEHPKRDTIVTWIVIGIGILIIFFSALPFFNIESNFIKGLLIVAAIGITGYPIGKHIYNKYKKDSTYEGRHGRKLK